MTPIFQRNKNADTHRLTFTKHTVPSSFQLDGVLQGSETITFHLVGIDKDDNIPWTDPDTGDAIELTASNSAPIPVYSPIDLYISKTSTINDVGLKLVG